MSHLFIACGYIVVAIVFVLAFAAEHTPAKGAAAAAGIGAAFAHYELFELWREGRR